MAINASGAVAVPLTVFGSWVTEVSPNAVPENISPDCQDNAYAPGEVRSRDGLAKVFVSAFPAGGPNSYVPTLVNGFSFKLPTGTIQNLYYDSNGVLWVEYFSLTPGAYTKLFQSTPGTYARFMGVFGRVYIAISDGLHGADVPLQWDGTLLRRVTQGGPATPPVVTSLALPPSSVAVSGTIAPVAVTNITSSGMTTVYEGPVRGYVTFWTSFTVTLATPPTSLSGAVLIAGNTNGTFNQHWPILAVISPTVFTVSFFSATLQTGTGGTATVQGGTTLVRLNNQVSGSTLTPHGLRIGYQALMQGNGVLALGGGISSIVINNEQNPGLATVTTVSAHGLQAENDVTITGVTPVLIGGAGSWTGVRSGGLVTLTTSGGAHGLVPDAVVQTSASSDASLDTNVTVALVPSPTQISFYQAIDADITTPATGISVALTWPIPDDTPDPIYFEVQDCPTPTSFTVQVTYSDGTWTSGAVGFGWDGTFYVNSVPSATSFTYLQYGPNGSTAATGGTVTPFGQCAPGLHLFSVSYLTDQGAITAPSVFGTFIANGGEYVSLTNIPLGPTNIVARIVQFTGAQPNVPGELPPFFYIPATPQLEGQIVGTATQINDNTTTSAVFDFSDNTLYASIGVSISGNNLANQIVLDGALAFGAYTSRLTTWGQRNTIQNLLNMGFDADEAGINNPQGWTTTGVANSGVTITSALRPAGSQWRFNASQPQTLSQGAFQDCYGDPIFQPNLTYKIRGWFQPAFVGTGGPSFTATLSSVSSSFTATATIANAAMNINGSFLEAQFSSVLPLAIPADMILTIGASTTVPAYSLVVDELWPIPIATPYTDHLAIGSYINNPEGMDGDSGPFGADDPSKLMDMAELRDTLYLLTQAPTGRLHETSGSRQTEPDGWDVEEVAANCGVLSAFGLTHSQADDTAASGGDDWMAWPSDSGEYIFGGGLPEKISQEIQPNWNDPTNAVTAVQINMAAATSVWSLCDPVVRLLYIGIPLGNATAPNKIYVLDFKNLGSAQAIAGSPPFHPSFAGKLIATDNSRKWAPWNMTMNGAARMYRSAGELTTVLFGGNGQAPGLAAGFGNCYTLDPDKKTDDDYGLIVPYYDTYFFVDPEKAQALGLKGTRILMAYLQAYIQGTGQVTATYFPDDLQNPWALTTTRTLTNGFFKDRQFGGGMCTGDRIAVRIGSSPITGTDNSFVMSRLTAFIKNARLSISGVNQ